MKYYGTGKHNEIHTFTVFFRDDAKRAIVNRIAPKNIVGSEVGDVTFGFQRSKNAETAQFRARNLAKKVKGLRVSRLCHYYNDEY